MALLCRHHLLCLGIGAECAPPVEIEQLFNGDVRRTIPCADTRPETIHAALDAVAPAGNGWGVRIRGSVDSLEAIGAFPVAGGAWVFEDPAGMMGLSSVYGTQGDNNETRVEGDERIFSANE